MSHYITASFGKQRDEGTELSYGVSWRTLSALESSGIDIYDLYQGAGHHAGMSGDGNTEVLSPEDSEKAYKMVIAWVLAMREVYPEAYQDEYGEVDPHFPDVPPFSREHAQILDHHPFESRLIESLRKEFSEDLKRYPLSEDQLDRSMGYLHPVLVFAKKIYEFTSSTNREVIMSFT